MADAPDTTSHARFQLAQVNIALLRAPLDTPMLADFVALLEPINAVADRTPGFIWRLQTEDGDATAIRAFGDDRIIVNMSVWESVETLAAFVYSDEHREIMRQRRSWFERMSAAHTALWWIPRGHIPTTGEAEERVIQLRVYGPTPHAFTLREHFRAPDAAGATGPGPVSSPEKWNCPA